MFLTPFGLKRRLRATREQRSTDYEAFKSKIHAASRAEAVTRNGGVHTRDAGSSMHSGLESGGVPADLPIEYRLSARYISLLWRS